MVVVIVIVVEKSEAAGVASLTLVHVKRTHTCRVPNTQNYLLTMPTSYGKSRSSASSHNNAGDVRTR